MRLGLFGGSFDPIHWGHIRPVLEAAAELELDRVVYLPTGRPPHKPDRRMAPALARYAMTELALLGFDHLHVSGLELSETAPSYTIDTLLHFRDAGRDDELHLLVGGDSFAELRSWHRWRDILEIARVAVLKRPDAAPPHPGEVPARGGVHLLSNQPLAVSSTEVRRCLSLGQRPPAACVPEAVVDFAIKYRLYR